MDHTSRWRRHSRLLRAVLVGVTTAAVVLPTTAAADTSGCQNPAPGAETLSCTPIPVDDSWHQLLEGVPGSHVWPHQVFVEGDSSAVTNPDGLLTRNGGRTTLTTTAAGSTRIVVDLGLLASGFVELGVTNASGAQIRMSYAEDRQYLGTDGDADTDPDGFFYLGRTLGTDDDPDGRADVFDPPSSPRTLTSPGLRGSQRYIAITLDGAGGATFDFVRVRQTNLAGRYDGHFLSSDPVLNHAWYASAYGTDLSTVRDQKFNPDARWVLIDGPKRDRLVYAGDLAIATLAGYYQGARYRRVARDSINVFACQQDPDGTFPAASRIDVPCDPADPGPPDGAPAGYEVPGEAGLVRIDSFTAWWVIDLAEYYQYSGDTAFATAMLSVARRAVQFFAGHTSDGVLFRTDTYDDKPGYNWHPPDTATGVDAYTNEAYYGALRSLAMLEHLVAQDDTAAATLNAHANSVRAALLNTFWDSTVGAMLLNTEDPNHDHTADANAGALLFGLLDQSQAQSAMAFLAQQLGTPYGTATSQFADNPHMTQFISPYILALETLGRFRYGDGSGALALIRTAWEHMEQAGPGTPWEQEGIDGTPNGVGTGNGNGTGLAHAWSTAVPALSVAVLGVRPSSPGYQTWTVAPQPVDLQWAQGVVPVPAGQITVRWTRTDTSFSLTVEAPTGTTGAVAVPELGTDRTIAMDGQIVWSNGQPAPGVSAQQSGTAVVFYDMTGSHTFAWATS